MSKENNVFRGGSDHYWKTRPPHIADGKCNSCGGTDWWESIHGGELCRHCNPPDKGAEKKK